MIVLSWIVAVLGAGIGISAFVAGVIGARRHAARNLRRVAGVPHLAQYGGARVGLAHGSRPFAHLTVTSDEMKLVFMWKDYEFPRAYIVRLSRSAFGGLRIHHRRSAYPKRIIFYPGPFSDFRDRLSDFGFDVED
jgi:hypothetical protein